MEQIFNPYLPLYEYIPDGEPHVFDGRIYIYGSHDKAGGTKYCEGHYQVWSAAEDDLTCWRNEGISYRRDQDPSNRDDRMQLWAPDVTRGPDGRYYLYYCLNFNPEIGVAVSDSPAGPFEFLGHVHYPPHILGGKTVQEGMVFDPAVLTDDDGRVYLYYGFAPALEKQNLLPELSQEEISKLPPEKQEMYEVMKNMPPLGENSMVIELEQDMVTAKEEPRVLIPGGRHTAGTGFEDHGFFEASSIRKFEGRYYFVYSSHKSHELCYAISDKPDKDYSYGGTIISNGDIGLNDREDPVYPLGNNHGGLEKIGDDYYIFYHRQTNGTEFSRQGCAEKVEISENGHISQVPVTSCGLNGRPLKASGIYPAAICCHLTDSTVSNRIDYNDPIMTIQVKITERNNQSYITCIKDKTTVGYKYFDFCGKINLMPEFRGRFDGQIIVSHDEKGEMPIGRLDISLETDAWKVHMIPVAPQTGPNALYFNFSGEGQLEFKTFGFAEPFA